MTQYVIGNRQEGKTTRLLKWVSEAPEGKTRILMCCTDTKRDQLRKENPQIAHRIMAYHPYMSDGWGIGDDEDIELAVDDVELLLAQILNRNANVQVIAGTGTVVVLGNGFYERSIK